MLVPKGDANVENDSNNLLGNAMCQELGLPPYPYGTGRPLKTTILSQYTQKMTLNSASNDLQINGLCGQL